MFHCSFLVRCRYLHQHRDARGGSETKGHHMNLINTITTVSDLVIHCKNAKVTPNACAEMILDTIDCETKPHEILGECMLIARELRNGYNQDYGRYGDKIIRQILNRI